MCTRGTASVAGGFHTSNSHSLFKDGRKIRVGDCALFEPPQDSPPFIGIIRCLIPSKESNLKFSVNWLYRASEVELENGIELEAAPNEIFYSFHKDEVPAASLLHPCKVAFLPKGVELPSGISSFICRRVYDIDQKCLWWLTDQNYIDKRQQEVNNLLSKTRREMHATAQSDGRSPKKINDSAQASHVKASSNGGQSVSSFSSHGKGKKRDRSDNDFEPVKRLQKIDDAESYQPKPDSVLKAAIARITDQGGLMDYDSVDKFVRLMVPEKSDQKFDLAERSMLAGVVAATDKFDCLSSFVQLKGLPVFDAWLQEVHKSKNGDVNSQKEADESVEEFLLVLLRALDKLPVNLRALQMCNIGKSVNHLRSHKSLEIQRKARSLVDTWKKRVEAEMNNDDGKPGSNMGVAWHGRRTSESSQGGHKNSCSSENAVKSSSSSQLSTPRVVLPKSTQGDAAQTSASTSPGYSKSALSPAVGVVNSKDAQSKGAAVGESSDHLLMTVKDEKSSSSQSFSQSSSSDHMKTAESLGKEDPRSSTAGSMGSGEMLRRTSRPRKPISGLPGPVSRGAHKDSTSHRGPSLNKPVISEKLSQSGSINEKMHDVPVADGNSQKLIVKIPNRGRSHAVGVNGGLVNEQCLSKSRTLSSACPIKQEKPYCTAKEKRDASQLNDVSDMTTKSWHSSDLKDVLTGSDEADGTSEANHDEDRSTIEDHSIKLNESPKVASSSAAHDTKPWKTVETSFSSMNALVESCVKHSEANALISAVDDVGMNLLASVAASEMSKSDSVATNSPGNTALAEDSGVGNSVKSSNLDDATQEQTPGTEKIIQHTENQNESTSLATNGRTVTLSNDETLATDISSSDLAKKQDNVRPCDTGAIASNEISMELAPDGQVSDEKKINEAECTEFSVEKCSDDCKNKVPKGPLVHTSGGSNRGFQNRPSEVVGSGVRMKESPSTIHSDDVGPKQKTHTPVSAEMCSDSANVINVERPSQRKIENGSNYQSDLEQIQLKSESHDYKSPTTADNSRNNKERNPQYKEVRGSGNTGSCMSKASVFKMVERPSTDTPSVAPSERMEMLKFDLNEGFATDDAKYEEQKSITGASCPTAVHVISPFPFPISAMCNGLPSSVTVAAAAKGAFVPPDDLLRIRGEIGWKGSAATSAFRPAEPRKTSELPANNSTPPSVAPSKSSRPFLNIDLNVPDDSMQDNMPSHSWSGDLPRNENSRPAHGFGGLDLDLNQMDEANEVGEYSTVTNSKIENPGTQSKPLNLPNGESSGRRNFDLNNGPMLEELGSEVSTFGQNLWSNMPSQPPVVSLRMNNAEMSNFVSWFPQGNAIPAVTIPPVLPDRVDQGFAIASAGTAQRIYYTPPGSNPFAPDVYTGPVLSSSPAISFPSAPYQYPMFPFGTSFPVPSATISGSTQYMDSTSGARHNLPAGGHSQYFNHPGAVSSGYPRPYLVSIPDGRSNGGMENSGRWGSLGLDLNSGPGSIEVEGRNDPSPFALRQFSVANSQAFTEEQMRMFQASGVVLKRKEPDGGWDTEKPKQSSWHS